MLNYPYKYNNLNQKSYASEIYIISKKTNGFIQTYKTEMENKSQVTYYSTRCQK